MKLKRSKYISVFFFVSFFISFSTNIALASSIKQSVTVDQKTHDHLHLNESVVVSNIADLLFEENENEDENEFDVDLSLVLIPFFLETFSQQNVLDQFHGHSISATPTAEPIYIKVANFRI